ncbi:MAG: NADH-quinone oxidoreductase subunit J [Ignavibacteriae bacterium]|jgi:NADH-quinone oxidoreductase subunit J|nr:NADH-quinone oxidoreductase subunit J [Ignavibacteriota bacterium]
MIYYTILFYVFAVLAVATAFYVVFAKNVIHSAFALFGTLFAVAGLFVLLNADFIAITQIMVYVGGILVLMIFGVMLTTKIADIDIHTKNLNRIPAILFSTGITVILIFILFTTKWNIKPQVQNQETVSQIGKLMLTTYLLPFEIASIVLLVALVGSAMYARKTK